LEENALNIDDSIQKILNVLLKKGNFLLVFGIIGAIIAYAYTNQFTTLTYTSSVEFLAYVDDSKS
jgi:capsular polysaccharide biosynthesis protein